MKWRRVKRSGKHKEDLECIEFHMEDINTILTLEEAEILEEGLKEFEAGKTVLFSVLTGV